MLTSKVKFLSFFFLISLPLFSMEGKKTPKYTSDEDSGDLLDNIVTMELDYHPDQISEKKFSEAIKKISIFAGPVIANALSNILNQYVGQTIATGIWEIKILSAYYKVVPEASRTSFSANMAKDLLLEIKE